MDVGPGRSRAELVHLGLEGELSRAQGNHGLPRHHPVPFGDLQPLDVEELHLPAGSSVGLDDQKAVAVIAVEDVRPRSLDGSGDRRP